MCTVIFAALTVILIGQVPSARAGILFTSGPPNGVFGTDIQIDIAANSFTLSAGDTVTGVDFAVWLLHGYSLNSVYWAILPAPTGTSPFVSGTVTPTEMFLFADTNLAGIDVDNEQFAISAWMAPTTGTYWLGLTSGIESNGSGGAAIPYWDENGNPNPAWTSFGGGGFLTAGFSFDITGTAAADVPEPGSFALGGLGILAVSILWRRGCLKREPGMRPFSG